MFQTAWLRAVVADHGPPQLQAFFLFLSVPPPLGPLWYKQARDMRAIPSLAAVTGCDVEAPP